MPDPFDDDDSDHYVSGDFYSIVGAAQINELEAVEKQREKEREAAKRLAEDQKSSAMTLMQLAGMKTRKELEQLAQAKDAKEDLKSDAERAKLKAEEQARLVNQFPPPNLTNQ